MNDKNKLKILAEAIVGNHINIRRDCDIHYCIHCDQQESYNGKEYVIQHCAGTENYCPVLLAEEILKSETPFKDALDELQADIVKPEPSKERFCPSCGGQETIYPVKGTEPYSEDYLMCNKCDSTFNKDEVIKEHFKRIYVLAQEYKEEFLHAINYEQYNLSSKADNPQFTEEWFNNIMIDCSICEYMTPHNYLLLINKMKEKGYIISSKPEESFSK